MSDTPCQLRAIAAPAAPAEKPGLRLWLAAAWAGHAGLLAMLFWGAPMRSLDRPEQGAAIDMLFEPAPMAVETLSSATLAPPGARLATADLADPGRIRIEAQAAPRAFHRQASKASAPATPPAAPQPPSSASAMPPPASAPSPGLVAALEARIHDAVQLAAIYPPAARQMRREGRAQIRFDYIDGAVASLAIAQSSRSALLDRAALDAVKRAAYPKAPPELGGTKLRLAVWVSFALTSL